VTRSAFGISAIFVSTARSPAALSLSARASALSSRARSFIAARSSAVNVDLCVVFCELMTTSCVVGWLNMQACNPPDNHFDSVLSLDLRTERDFPIARSDYIPEVIRSRV